MRESKSVIRKLSYSVREIGKYIPYDGQRYRDFRGEKRKLPNKILIKSHLDHHHVKKTQISCGIQGKKDAQWAVAECDSDTLSVNY